MTLNQLDSFYNDAKSIMEVSLYEPKWNGKMIIKGE
jgi:hypothetical protein